MMDGTRYRETDQKCWEAKNWFAVFTISRHEKRVEQHLRVRNIENYLPLFQMQRRWKDGSKGMLQIPVFCNYIFVRIGRDGRIPVLKVPGVISIVGFGLDPCPLLDSYVHFLREGLREGKIEPYPYLTEGARVRIRNGIMAGFEGVLLRNKSSCRVVITVEMIGKSVSVEVSKEDIEPVGRTGPGRLPNNYS